MKPWIGSSNTGGVRVCMNVCVCKKNRLTVTQEVEVDRQEVEVDATQQFQGCRMRQDLNLCSSQTCPPGAQSVTKNLNYNTSKHARTHQHTHTHTPTHTSMPRFRCGEPLVSKADVLSLHSIPSLLQVF